MKRQSMALLVGVTMSMFGCNADGQTTSSGSKCLVDEIGALENDWTERTDCTAGDDKCRADCLAGDGNACLNRGFALPVSDKKSMEAFERACRSGVALGCTNWAGALWADGSKATDACMKRMFDTARAAGETMSCAMIGRALIEDPRTPFDSVLGPPRLLHECASEAGPACRFLALYLERGFVGPRTDALSPALIRRACEGRDVVACGEHRTASEIAK